MSPSPPVVHRRPVRGSTGTFGEFGGRGPAQRPDRGSMERHRKLAVYLAQFTVVFTTNEPMRAAILDVRGRMSLTSNEGPTSDFGQYNYELSYTAGEEGILWMRGIKI